MSSVEEKRSWLSQLGVKALPPVPPPQTTQAATATSPTQVDAAKVNPAQATMPPQPPVPPAPPTQATAPPVNPAQVPEPKQPPAPPTQATAPPVNPAQVPTSPQQTTQAIPPAQTATTQTTTPQATTPPIAPPPAPVAPPAPAHHGGGGGNLLHRGSNGPSVTKLQESLKSHGCDPGQIDGVFGRGTETAVKAFQQKNNLKVDGLVGPATAAALGITLPSGGGGHHGGGKHHDAGPKKPDGKAPQTPPATPAAATPATTGQPPAPPATPPAPPATPPAQAATAPTPAATPPATPPAPPATPAAPAITPAVPLAAAAPKGPAAPVTPEGVAPAVVGSILGRLLDAKGDVKMNYDRAQAIPRGKDVADFDWNSSKATSKVHYGPEKSILFRTVLAEAEVEVHWYYDGKYISDFGASLRNAQVDKATSDLTIELKVTHMDPKPRDGVACVDYQITFTFENFPTTKTVKTATGTARGDGKGTLSF
jgi:peptidoglycan hydrolase-like protein with peptidoglycan-binding domain